MVAVTHSSLPLARVGKKIIEHFEKFIPEERVILRSATTKNPENTGSEGESTLAGFFTALHGACPEHNRRVQNVAGYFKDDVDDEEG